MSVNSNLDGADTCIACCCCCCVSDDEFTGEVAEDGLSQFGHMMAGAASVLVYMTILRGCKCIEHKEDSDSTHNKSAAYQMLEASAVSNHATVAIRKQYALGTTRLFRDGSALTDCFAIVVSSSGGEEPYWCWW